MRFKFHTIPAMLLSAAVLLSTAVPAGAGVSRGRAAANPPADPVVAMLGGLIDQDNRSLADGRFAGRYMLVNFVFTGCGNTCPMQTANLVRFERNLAPALRGQVRLLSISIDPGNDRPAALKAFAAQQGVDLRRWSFATGRPDRVMQVAREFAALRPGTAGPADHTSEVWLFDRQHRMVQRYNGVPLSTTQIRRDLLALMQINH